MMSSRAHFAVVEQSVTTVRKVEGYITAGMETVIDVAQDFVQHDKGNEQKLAELKDIMLQYAKMEQDLHQFLESVDQVKAKALQDEETNDLVKKLESQVAELKKGFDPNSLKKHEKFEELDQIIQDTMNPEGVLALQDKEEELDDDIAMTQQEIVTKCPYTGMEMTKPMKNKHCGHRYDKVGVEDLLKRRHGRAKCPVSGCVNSKPIAMADLIEDREFKRFIEAKNRQAGKRANRGANTSLNTSL